MTAALDRAAAELADGIAGLQRLAADLDANPTVTKNSTIA